MVRVKVRFTSRQLRALKELAAAQRRSVAAIVRTGVDAFLRSRPAVDRRALRQEAIALAGRFRSGSPDLGTEHDRHLEKAFRR